MDAIKQILRNWHMVLHEAVNSFEEDEYNGLFDLKKLADEELVTIQNELENLRKITSCTEPTPLLDIIMKKLSAKDFPDLLQQLDKLIFLQQAIASKDVRIVYDHP